MEILLIEDNPYDAELTIKALEKTKLNTNLLHLKDGEEAMDYFSSGNTQAQKQFSPRLILLDLKLPKVNGLELLKTIRTKDHSRRIPVIVLSSSTEKSDIIQSYQLGANSYIVKPIDFNIFVDTISKIEMYWLQLNEAPIK
jgi:two-component system, response regulator